MKGLHPILALFLLVCPMMLTADSPKQAWVVSDMDMAMALPKSKVQGYNISINRNFANKREEELLKKAEAVYPDQSVVRDAMKAAHFKLKKNPPAGELVWWSSEFDGVRIPYSITASAVKYYDDLITAFNKGDFSSSNGIKMLTASLNYRSSIHIQDKWEYDGHRFNNVYVVEIELRWSQYCGNVCAMDFHKKKYVVMDKSGVIQAVFGDGTASTVVS